MNHNLVRSIFWLILTFLFGSSVITTIAQSKLDLIELARYFPEDTLIFTAFRTDDTTIEEIDTMLQHILSKLPSGIVPPVSLHMLLDLASQDISGKDFASGVRLWLGDSMAFGMEPFKYGTLNDSGFLGILSITNRSAIEELASSLWRSPDYEISVVNGYTVFQSLRSFQNVTFALGDDTLMVSNSLDNLPINGISRTLNDSLEFNETISLLPADEYNAVAFMDGKKFLSIIMQESPSASMLLPFVEVLGSQAMGLTNVNSRSITIDFIDNVGDLDQIGLTLQDVGTIDPAFTSHIPANASLVIHGTNIQALYNNLLQTAHWSIKTLGMSSDQFDEGMSTVSALVQALIGLDLDQDIFSWMTGDFAIFISIDNDAIFDWYIDYLSSDPWVFDEQLRERYVEDGFNVMEVKRPLPALERLPIDFGIVIRATDTAKAQTLASAFATLLTQLASQDPTIEISQIQVEGTNVTMLHQPLQISDESYVPLEITVGANENVFVLATRPSTERILSGEEGLDTVPSFVEAQTSLLNNPNITVYLTSVSVVAPSSLALLGPTIGNVFCNIIPLNNPNSTPVAGPTPDPDEGCRRIRREQIDQITRSNEEARRLLPILYDSTNSIFSSASISTSTTSNNDLILRFVLTLGD